MANSVSPAHLYTLTLSVMTSEMVNTTEQNMLGSYSNPGSAAKLMQLKICLSHYQSYLFRPPSTCCTTLVVFQAGIQNPSVMPQQSFGGNESFNFTGI